MTTETTRERPRSEGVLVIWRETSPTAKALLLGIFVNKLASFIQIFLVLFLTHRGFSSGQAGLALGVYGAGAVLGTFAGGSLSDRLAPRSATLISMVGSALLLVSILYLHVYPLLLLAVLLVSTVGQVYRPAAQALLTELTPPARLVMVTAMYRLSLNLGTTAAPLLGAALVTVSYDLLFWGEALASLAYALIALTLLPKRRATAEAKATGEPQPKGSYLAMMADWRYLVFLLAVLLMSIVYCQYTATLPLAVTGSGLSLWWYGLVVSLNGFIVITCELLMTKVVAGWPMRLTMLAGFGLVAIGYGVYAFAMVPVILVAGTLIWTLSEIIGAPTVFAYPGLTAPEHLRGRYIGAMQSLFGLGTALGPVLGIALWNQVGNWVWAWAGGVSVLATVAAQVAIKTRPQRS